jgi:hypothetical protein
MISTAVHTIKRHLQAFILGHRLAEVNVDAAVVNEHVAHLEICLNSGQLLGSKRE